MLLQQLSKWLPWCTLGLAIVVGLPLLAEAAMPAQEPTPTPPLPTWTPGSPPTKTPVSTIPPAPPPAPAGGIIELRAPLTPPALRDVTHWQELWTVVQWQDAWGDWHDVEGWQGTLDTVVIDEDGEIVGRKLWWVAEADLGKGPFRWLIYVPQDHQDPEGKKSERLATSDLFYLPDSDGQTVPVEVLLDKERTE